LQLAFSDAISSILSIPVLQAVATLGVLLGAVLIIVVYILSYYTINILARCGQSNFSQVSKPSPDLLFWLQDYVHICEGQAKRQENGHLERSLEHTLAGQAQRHCASLS
jgi:hypothetical protein